MRVRLAVAALVNSVFVNRSANMTAGARRINMGIYFLPIAIPSESVPRSISKASTHSYAEKKMKALKALMWHLS